MGPEITRDRLMTIEAWLAFVVASAVLVLIPGPAVILTISYALRGGRSTGWGSVPGVVAGAFVAMSLSLLGAGAVVATSATLFSLLKLAGAAYLIWLAYQLWTSPVTEIEAGVEPNGASTRSIFFRALLVNVLNPKGPVFYMAFVPQFVSADSPVFPQFAILVATFLVVAAINGVMWVLFASTLRPILAKPRALKAVNRTGATCMFVAGVATASASRSS